MGGAVAVRTHVVVGDEMILGICEVFDVCGPERLAYRLLLARRLRRFGRGFGTAPQAQGLRARTLGFIGGSK